MFAIEQVLKTSNQKPQWLDGFWQQFIHVSEQNFAQVKKQQIPQPFLQKLSDFYVAIAKHNFKGLAPNWQNHNYDLDFYILFYPFPSWKLPDIGKMELSDKKLQQAIYDLRHNPCDTLIERRKLARSYISAKASGVEKYINQVKAAIIDSDYYGKYAYYSEKNGEQRAA